MSMMKPMRLGLALTLAGCISPALALNSLWPAATPAQPLPAGRAECTHKPPPPYTGSLQLDSKYQQSDSSKSTLSNSRPSATTREAAQRSKAFIKGLQVASHELNSSRNPQRRAQALSCLNLWLDSWAAAAALESRDSSSTGMAARKWALAAISGTLLRNQALSGGTLRPSHDQQAWLQRLARQVMKDYQPRRQPGFRYYNNHDYWAAWAVAATGMLVQRSDYLEWAYAGLAPMFQQLVERPGSGYAYLPLETARGKLGSDYSHYAMVPLTLLVETREANGRPLSPRERELFRKLARFTALSSLEPRRLPELSQPQQAASRHKMVWLIPFLNRHPDHADAHQLYLQNKGKVDNYSQLGGPLKPFYPAVKP